MKNKIRNSIQLHPFHLVDSSPWPIITAFSLMDTMLSIALSSHNYLNNNFIIIFNIFILLIAMTLWFKDIIAESTYLGAHTLRVKKGLYLGFMIFTLSEIIIFISLFWSYLHSAINPTVYIGMIWPPYNIEAISPIELPLLNTIILLCSGVTITYAHHALIAGLRNKTLFGFIISTLLILLFIICQYFEYKYSNFTLSDSVYGSTFFSTTGLHGLHMIMLTIMLALCSFRFFNYDFTINSHLFAELSIIYLHILDVIWLFIYIVMYWWGS